jgi:hypothetical protein
MLKVETLPFTLSPLLPFYWLFGEQPEQGDSTQDQEENPAASLPAAGEIGVFFGSRGDVGCPKFVIFVHAKA